jgi:hypothetical protein
LGPDPVKRLPVRRVDPCDLRRSPARLCRCLGAGVSVAGHALRGCASGRTGSA